MKPQPLVLAINRKLAIEQRVVSKKPRGSGIYELLDIQTGRKTSMNEGELKEFARKIGATKHSPNFKTAH
jgi:hypothetical protein